MTLYLFDSESELEFSNLPDEDEEYICLPTHERAELEEREEEEEEEELVLFSKHGGYKQEEEKEEMDKEQQDMCEGSLSNFGQYLCCVCIWSLRDKFSLAARLLIIWDSF